MKKNKIYIPLLLLSLAGSSCTNSLLNMTPDSSLTTTNFYKTANDMDQAVIGIYSSMQDRKPKDYILMEMPGDNLYMGTAMPGVNDLDYLTVNAENTAVADFWEKSYYGIGRANAVLENIDRPTDYPGGKKEQFTGEAKFMRALFYFDLVRLYGGVPLVTKTPSISEAKNMPRESADKIYDMIISDLKEAIDLLPAPATAIRGRASKGAATGLLGKVYIYRKDWANAKTYLEKTIRDFNYQLEPNFATLWSLATEDNKEIILAIKYTDGSNGHSLGIDFAPIGGLAGIVGSGNQYAFPSWSLNKKYVAGDTRKASTISDYVVKATSPNDPPAWGPYVKKYATKFTGSTSGQDLPVLRLADVVLLYAEALYNTGDKGNALLQLNAIRERAFGDASHDYTAADIASADSFLDLLLQERQLELAYENERWTDLVRTGKFMTVMTSEERDYNPATSTATKVTLSPKATMAVFPIPQRQIDQYTPGVLKQNEGY
ncbi:RagB/SusD family nutrient uptake outer membrane protein [Chitinophaga sp. HK235]|uniref:RagB/SusD family nutrient uptake outer membrane protein n=1 Tax=Chitinophaga sp. HK235 TaxID=2952571 RepID=UPI001BAA65F8|nr:RagB/SusD family nutrient uptake outer membrane protein [Chitinophaga sp. HK235]